MPGPDPAGQDLLGELAVGHAGQIGIERQAIEHVHAQSLEGAGLLVGGHQPEGRGVRLEPAPRMRFEGHDAQDGAKRLRRPGSLGDDLPVAQMDAVEIAERHRRAPVVGGDITPVGHDPQSAVRCRAHGRKLIPPQRPGGP